MKSVRSVERAISILFLVCQSDSPLGLSDISRSIGLDKATALRLLNTLGNSKLVQQDASTRRYIPGSNISRLYSFWRSDIRNVSRPYLEKLLQKVEETICLITPRGLERVCIEALQPDRELRIVAAVGRANPIYAGASGRVLLAYRPSEEITRILEQNPLMPITGTTETDYKAYLKQLEGIREQGYFMSIGEVTEGSSALAAPIFDESGMVVAAVAIRGPEARMTEEKGRGMAPILLKTTQAIGTELGHKNT